MNLHTSSSAPETEAPAQESAPVDLTATTPAAAGAPEHDQSLRARARRAAGSIGRWTADRDWVVSLITLSLFVIGCAALCLFFALFGDAWLKIAYLISGIVLIMISYSLIG